MYQILGWSGLQIDTVSKNKQRKKSKNVKHQTNRKTVQIKLGAAFVLNEHFRKNLFFTIENKLLYVFLK